MRILNTEPDAYDDQARGVLATIGQVDDAQVIDEGSLVEALKAAPYDALLVRLGVGVTTSVLDAGPRLRWVASPTTGVDHIDVDQLGQRGIELICLRGERDFLATIATTAEHTWALVLALRRRLLPLREAVSDGSWERVGVEIDELAGATLGVIGCGRLGRMTAGYGHAFGMHVLAFDLDHAAVAAAPGHPEPTTLEDLLRRSDVVTLHLPLTAATAGVIGKAELSSMRTGALLVNTARGELIDEDALLASLESGHLGGAALDVLAGDSRWAGASPVGHPLIAYARDHPELIITPHVGGYGRRSVALTRRFIAERLAERARLAPPTSEE